MKRGVLLLLAGALTAVASAPVSADVASDRPAAILVFPRIVASRFTAETSATDRELVLTDTLVQISNTSNEAVDLHCWYVNATGRCSVSDTACDPAAAALGCPDPRDLCLPRWTEVDFPIVLTPRQPLVWRASRGLRREDLPLDGRDLTGPRGDGNGGTLVPPVRLRAAQGRIAASIFVGELTCVVVDGEGRGVARNAIKGEATVETLFDASGGLGDTSSVVASRYNAVGILAIDGDANGDRVLELGGEAGEYNACSNLLVAQHLFDGATVPPLYEGLRTELTLVPCARNFRSAIPGATTAQLVVVNEFEQRLSTSVRVDCLLRSYLSELDTGHPERSIFSVGVAGTLAGQTRIRGVDGGLIGLLTEVAGDQVATPGIPAGETASHLGLQGDREGPDRITLPR